MDIPLFERPESSLEHVALGDIEPWSASGARSYTARSIGTLSLRGVVMLKRLPPGSQHSYRVIDGNRRLNEALIEGLEHVRAEVLPEATDPAEAAALRLGMNLARGTNPLQEAEAIRELFDAYRFQGVPERDILSTIGKAFEISTAKLSKRLGLLTLPPTLVQAVAQGKLAAGVAGKIANLPPAQQAQLAHELEAKGKLTAHDVKAVRQVKQEAALAALPESLFAPLETPLERARVVIESFLDEGVKASELISLVEQLGTEREVV